MTYENPDMAAARAIGLCGALMPNDMHRRSGRQCERTAGHAGPHASQYSATGRRDRIAAVRRRTTDTED